MMSMEKIEMFREAYKPWESETFFDRQENWIENVFEVRSGMHPKIEIQPVDMMLYKKTILEELMLDFTKKSPFDSDDSNIAKIDMNFTEQELIENRISQGPNSGQKITKLLHKAMYGTDGRTLQVLDFFHKLRTENNVSTIESCPIAMLEAYTRVQTCISAGGQNQSSILKYLFSPFTYIINSGSKKSRMVAFIDFPNKKVFLNPVYGEFDKMFEISVIQYFIKEGFEFLDDFRYFSVDDSYYVDRHEFPYKTVVKILNGKIFDVYKNGQSYSKDIFQKPDWVKYKGDGLAINNNYYEGLTTSLELHDQDGIYDSESYFCSQCGCTVGVDEYNFDCECCYECSNDYEEEHTYCEKCGSTVDNDDYDFENDCCYDCAEELKENEKEESK